MGKSLVSCFFLRHSVHYYTLPELLSYNIPHYRQIRDWKVETMNKPVYRLYTVLQKCTLGHISQYGCILLLQTDSLSFYLSVWDTLANPAKTAEAIEMLFRGRLVWVQETMY